MLLKLLHQILKIFKEVKKSFLNFSLKCIDGSLNTLMHNPSRLLKTPRNRDPIYIEENSQRPAVDFAKARNQSVPLMYDSVENLKQEALHRTNNDTRNLASNSEVKFIC